jgi:16S rRNA (cytidine1402-2'-O)-methyltransferase
MEYGIIFSVSDLYIVSTPIGNLKDITLRAIEVLRAVDLILAEDTRKTIRLLSHLKIKKPLESFHEHNEKTKIDQILHRLATVTSVALVSDAGTPLISDPGFKLVREAVKRGIKVTPIPGASSILVSLVASGLPTDQFLFLGYLPKKLGKQNEILQFIERVTSARPTTIVLFESPFRIKRPLQALADRFPNKETVIAREVTKIHEEFIRGILKEVLKKDFPTKGEFTLLLR